MKDKQMITMYKVTTSFACGAISVQNNKVIEKGTAPIFKNFIGHTFENLKNRLSKKFGEVGTERIYEEEVIE